MQCCGNPEKGKTYSMVTNFNPSWLNLDTFGRAKTFNYDEIKETLESNEDIIPN